MNPGNLYAPTAADDDEVFDELLRTPGFRLERIVSRGQVSPPGFWYDQAQHEWVALLRGRAVLRLADPEQTVVLGPGDHLRIAAHRRHRVEWTDPVGDTVWLALHYPADGI